VRSWTKLHNFGWAATRTKTRKTDDIVTHRDLCWTVTWTRLHSIQSKNTLWFRLLYITITQEPIHCVHKFGNLLQTLSYQPTLSVIEFWLLTSSSFTSFILVTSFASLDQLSCIDFQIQISVVLKDISGFNCLLPFFQVQIVTVLPESSSYKCFLWFSFCFKINGVFFGI
jgi:hypothetical protein